MGEPARLADVLPAVEPIPDLPERIQALADRAAERDWTHEPPLAGPAPTTPPDYRVGFAALEQTKEVRAVARWAGGWHPGSRWLVVAGPVGTGKSTLAGAIATHLGDPWPARYVWVPGWLQQLKATFDTRTTPRTTVERLVGSRLLLLDDLGAERGTEWEAGQLAHVVAARYDRAADGCTVITTNLGPRDLEDRIGRRAVSRILKRAAWVTLTGSDRRRGP